MLLPKSFCLGGMNSDEVIMGTTKAASLGLMLVLSSATHAQDRESQAPSLDLEGLAAAKKTVAIDGLLNREPLEGAISNWTLSFEGSYSVPMSCGRAWQEGSSVVVMVGAGDVTLASSGGKQATITFRTQDALLQCIGLTTKIRFPQSQWVPFFAGEYRNGRPQASRFNPARRLGRRTDVGGHMTGRNGLGNSGAA